MATPSELLAAIAAGNAPTLPTQQQPVIVQQASGSCGTTVSIPPTPPGIPINPNLMYTGQCGQVNLCIINPKTEVVYLPIGFNRSFATVEGSNQSIEKFGKLLPVDGSKIATSSANAAVLSCDHFYSTPQPSAAGVRFLNELTSARSLIFGGMTIRFGGPDAPEVARIQRTLQTLGFVVEPEMNFADCVTPIDANLCDPCFNEAGIASYTFQFGTNSDAGFLVPIAPSLSTITPVQAQIQLCVIGKEGSKSYEPCGRGSGGAY